MAAENNMKPSAPCVYCENVVCNSVIETTLERDVFRTYQVECDQCKARGPKMRSEWMAVKVWDARCLRV
jgi:hypothetical protein